MQLTIDFPKPLSFRQRIWSNPGRQETDIDPRFRESASPAVAKILQNRCDPDQVSAFLTPKLKNLIPDPARFHGMREGARAVIDAIRRQETIGIFSDYDADGATSAAILGWFLRMIGHDRFHLRIPDRIAEGYGPNGPALREMQVRGCNTIVILDSGTVAFDALEEARNAGITVVVIDHHASEDELPPAAAIINPNRRDEVEGYEGLCAAAMTFLFVIDVCRLLFNDGTHIDLDGNAVETPDLMDLLDLVGLGTVADVMPLNHPLNRAFVVQGLKRMNGTKRPGIAALCDVSGLRGAISERDLGWILGPRINAGGRIGTSDSGARLLLETDPDQAREMADALDQLNQQRRTMERDATSQALEQCATLARQVAIAVVDSHEGVVGISAGRVKEALDVPAIVLTPTGSGLLKGSARSVEDVDIGRLIIEARQSGLIERGGGHPMAGGVSLHREQIPAFQEFLDHGIRGTDYARNGVRVYPDLMIDLDTLTPAFIRDLEALRPFGPGNPQPLVMLEGLRVENIRVMKSAHYKLELANNKGSIDGLAWNAADTPFGNAIMAHDKTSVDVVGRLELNDFNQRVVPQIIIEDIRKST